MHCLFWYWNTLSNCKQFKIYCCVILVLCKQYKSLPFKFQKSLLRLESSEILIWTDCLSWEILLLSSLFHFHICLSIDQFLFIYLSHSLSLLHLELTHFELFPHRFIHFLVLRFTLIEMKRNLCRLEPRNICIYFLD